AVKWFSPSGRSTVSGRSSPSDLPASAFAIERWGRISMSRAGRRGVRRLAGLLAGVMVMSLTFAAQGGAADERMPAAAADPHQMTPADLGAFFDGMTPYAIGQANIAGAAIAVVADGHILFAKGYGFADVIEPARLHELHHLDGGDATRAGGQARSGSGHQRLSRFRGAGAVRTPDHAARCDDAFDGVRGCGHRSFRQRGESALSAAEVPAAAHATGAPSSGQGRRILQLRDGARGIYRSADLG